MARSFTADDTIAAQLDAVAHELQMLADAVVEYGSDATRAIAARRFTDHDRDFIQALAAETLRRVTYRATTFEG